MPCKCNYPFTGNYCLLELIQKQTMHLNNSTPQNRVKRAKTKGKKKRNEKPKAKEKEKLNRKGPQELLTIASPCSLTP